MSTVINNVITEGLSGKISDKYTFAQIANGKTILKRIGLKKGEPTPAQQAQREKFKLVVQQAKEALQDPIQKAAFEAQTKKGDTLLGTTFKYFYTLMEESTTNEGNM